MTTASGGVSTAFGSNTEARGIASTAFGSGTKAIGYESTAFGSNTEARGFFSTAWGAGAKASGFISTAFGLNTTASGSYSTAWGYEAKAYGHYTTAFGDGAVAGVEGDPTKGDYATAWGGTTTASGHYSTAFGYNTTASGIYSTAWGNKSIASSDYSTAFGDSSKAEAENSLAALGGTVETAAINSAAIGKGATVKVADAIALGSEAVASVDKGVAGYDPATGKASTETSGAWTSTHAAVSIGTADGSVTRQITGVAAGTEDTDAVNVAQLKKVAAGAVYTAGDGVDITDNKVSVKADANDFTFDSGMLTLKKDGAVASDHTGIVTGGTVYSEVRPADGTYVKAANTTAANLDALDKQVDQNAKDIKTNADGIKDLDNRVTQNENDIADLKAGGGADLSPVNHRIDKLDSKINKVGAGAAALAALHPLDTDNKFTMAAGFGNYRNANAMALGMFYRPTDKVMFSVGGAMGNGENMINAGVSFALDKGVGTSKAAMAKKIEALEEENAEIKAQNATILEQNAKLEARLAALEAKMEK